MSVFSELEGRINKRNASFKARQRKPTDQTVAVQINKKTWIMIRPDQDRQERIDKYNRDHPV